MILQPIDEKLISELPDDRREVFLLSDGKIRLTAVSATEMINHMRANHHLGIIETYVLGQAYIAAALLQSNIKGRDRIRIDIECGGPIKGLSVESWASGAVRGYLFSNPIPLDKPLESFDTSLLYGPGFLSVTKILEGSRTPFTGQIMMEHGNLAQDLALYFAQSEQTPTLIYLSIRFDRQGNAIGGGGIFIQGLPGCPEDILAKAQDAASCIKDLGTEISEGVNIKEYILKSFASLDPVHEKGFPIGFSCPCSASSYAQYLKTIPEKDKTEMLSQEGPVVLECFNCGTEYEFSHDDLAAIFQEGK